MAKQRNYEQVAAAQQKAIRAAETLQEDDDLADEIESLSVEEYAERKGFQIINPSNRRTRMAVRTRKSIDDKDDYIADLEAEIDELQDIRDELVEKLENVQGVLSGDIEIVDEEDEEDEEEAV